VRHRRYALGPFGQENTVTDIHALEPSLDSAMLVEHPGPQVGNVLTRGVNEIFDCLEHS
jgi:hypothetical protein